MWEVVDDRLIANYPAMGKKLVYVESITGVRKDHILLSAMGVFMLYVITGYFAAVSSDVISLLFPLYNTVRAIEGKKKDVQEAWLLYWVVYGVVTFVEYMAGRLLGLLPAYFMMRTVFLVWCMTPSNENGSHVVYHQFISPFFLYHQSQFESALGLTRSQEGSENALDISEEDSQNDDISESTYPQE